MKEKSMDQKPTNWAKNIHGLVKPDWLFAIMLALSIGMFLMPRSELQIGGGLVVSSLIKTLLVFGLMALVSFLTTIGISLDRKLADDYYFQLMANGAIVAIVSTLIMVGLFVLLPDVLPALSIKEVFSLLMGAWALGYFFYRVRGLADE